MADFTGTKKQQSGNGWSKITDSIATIYYWCAIQEGRSADLFLLEGQDYILLTYETSLLEGISLKFYPIVFEVTLNFFSYYTIFKHMLFY